MGSKKGRPPHPRKGFVALYRDIQDSPAWMALTSKDRDLYLSMRRRLGPTNNGDISATLETLRPFGFTSSSTLAASLRALIAVGLIAVTRQGGVCIGSKVSNLYRFTDEPMNAIPGKAIDAMSATNDWKKFENKSQAIAAIKAADEASRVRGAKRTTLKSKHTGSGIESKRRSTDSDFEQDRLPTIRNSKREFSPAIA